MALGVGLSLGLLAFIGGLAIDLQIAIKLGVIGIVLGAVGGAIAAAVDRVPTNRYRSVWRRQPRSYLSNIYRYHSGVTYRKDLDNDDGESDEENDHDE